MRLAYIIVPISGTVIAIIIMLGYDIDEKRSGEIRKQLSDRQNAAGTPPAP